jgi:DNA-damage-inducible protein J
MALDSTVRARIDTQLKEEVEEIFKQIGLTTSQAITIFMNRVKHERGIPFELKIPNDKTLQAMEEADNGIGETVSYEAFIKESEAHAKTLQN